MYKLVFILALLIAGSASAFRIQMDEPFYVFNAEEAETLVTGARDSIRDSLGAATGDSILLYWLGKTPSDVGDSGTIGIVNFSATKVSCTLFVNTSQDPAKKYDRNYQTILSAQLFTDSLQNGATNSYVVQIPNLSGKMGFGFLLKLVLKTGGARGEIRKVYLLRNKQ